MGSRKLPEDLVTIILSMLPVKSLLRFKCVCKSWCVLIRSPSFIHLHLANRSSNPNNDCLIVKRSLRPDNRPVLSFLSNRGITLDDDVHIPPFTSNPGGGHGVTLVASCNGLVCITRYYHDIVLCNPATREFKPLSVPPITGYPDHLTRSPLGVGFGFDPVSGDYKVVRIVDLIDDDEDDGILTEHDYHKLHVYNLSTNSWREIDSALPVQIFYSPCFETLFNGAFHWYALEGDHGGEYIFSFHISNEVVQLIPLPDICTRSDGLLRTLVVLNESIALILYPRNNWDLVSKHFDIWVMDEYGVKESWTRHFKIGPLFGIDYPLAFWKNGELLMDTSDGQLVSYNFKDQKVERFPIHGVPSDTEVQPTLGVAIYSESLVSINS